MEKTPTEMHGELVEVIQSFKDFDFCPDLAGLVEYAVKTKCHELESCGVGESFVQSTEPAQNQIAVHVRLLDEDAVVLLVFSHTLTFPESEDQLRERFDRAMKII